MAREGPGTIADVSLPAKARHSSARLDPVSTTTPTVTTAATWVAERLPCRTTHLDIAACGRPSRAVRRAEIAQLTAHSETGGYPAQAADEPLLDAGRAALGGLVGLGGADVAYVENASAGFLSLLAAWPLEGSARVGWVRGDYGSNARALARLARERGWELVELPVDELGHILDVPPGLDVVTFPQIPSQRGIVQPVAEVQRATDAPLLLDVAQSLGQVQVPGGCAAYVGTSRKWLCGPRGAGFVAVDPAWEPRLTDPPSLSAESPGMLRFDPGEASIASRAGLAVAAREWDPAVVPVITAAARQARQTLDGVGGWQVVEPVAEPSGITTLRPPPGIDVPTTRERLLAAGTLVSAVPQVRALDLDGPVLRVSTAAWVTSEDIAALAAELAS